MFGLISLPKILLTAAVIFAVWYGFRRLSQRQPQDEGPRRAGKVRSPRAAEVADAEDMAKCPVCGTYVSLDAPRSCGREDCPYPD